jgi:molybdate transport system ATP-binding protein
VFDLDLGLRRRGFELDWKLVTDKRWLGLFGASGRGKTTALELLLGWQRSTRGHVRRPDIGRGVGYAPQDLLLFPHWTVAENLAACRRGSLPGGLSDAALFAALDIEALLPRRAERLSGGEGRRVALARAILAAPDEELLVLDEPLSSLDRSRRVRVLGFLLALKDARRGPVVVVSHSAVDLTVLADVVQRIEVETDGSGVRSTFSAPVPAGRALGSEGAYENLLFGKVLELQDDAARCRLAGEVLEITVPSRDLHVGERALFGLRSDDVLLGIADPGRVSARNKLVGEVAALREEGPYINLEIDLGPGAPRVSTHLTVGATRDLGLEVGAPVHLFFKTRSVRLLARLP